MPGFCSQENRKEGKLKTNEMESAFQTAQSDWHKGSADAWQKIFLMINNCCRAICLRKNYRQRENLEDLISNATLICMERLKKDPQLQIKKLSSFCFYPCLEQLAERKEKRRKSYRRTY